MTFGVASLGVASILGLITLRLASEYMLDQRQQSANLQATVNQRLVRASMVSGSDAMAELLNGLAGDPGSTVLVRGSTGWLSSGRWVDPKSLPGDLLEQASQGHPGWQTATIQDIPVLMVALPGAAADGIFVELFPLIEFDRTTRYLTTVLVIGALATGLLGLGLGWWASRRALRPLTELNAAAARVARGDLHARLPDRGDPDLAPIAATFNATAASLEQRVLRDARFAGDVSHELRSPLTTIANAVEVLVNRRDDLPATAGQAVDLLNGEVRRFQRMVLDLLEISRADQDLDQRSWEPVDLGTLVFNVAQTHPESPSPLIQQHPPLVLADRRRLVRVVANLLDNAQRHGGGVIRIVVTERAGNARLEIDDAGPGIPDDLKTQVFERFARGRQAGDRGDETGTGLGLALVAQHVRNHHGTCWIEDRPGGGARFVVELPEHTDKGSRARSRA
ncbi:MAG: HAMP domain-containing sensor histidine kinase [Nakamurella sp.]